MRGKLPMKRTRSRLRRAWVILLMALVVAGGAAYLLRRPLLSRLGRALVVADPLEKADAAVVWAGRPMSQDRQLYTAARLYREGWVRKLVLSGPEGPLWHLRNGVLAPAGRISGRSQGRHSGRSEHDALYR